MRFITIFLSLSLLLSPFAVHANPFSSILNKVLKPDPPTGAVPTAENALRTKEIEFKIFGFGTGMSLDALMWQIGRILIDKMSDAVVDWVNKGYKGGPSFVTDPRQFFGEITDSVGGVIIQDIGAGALCSPLRLQVQASLRNRIQGLQTRPGDQLQNRCTFTSAVGNIQNFLDGDFSQGGWNGWFHLTQRPQNNPYGAFIETDSELMVRIGNSKDLARLEVDWAGGFLSPRKFPQDCRKVDPVNAGRCLEWNPAKTPGKTIEKSVEDALGTELKQLELADEVDEIIGAVLGRLISDIASKGLFKNTPGWTTGPGNPNAGNPIGGSCYPSNPSAIVGDTITWSVTSAGSNLSYAWSGTDGLSGTGQTASITYTTSGTKDASVVVTDTITDPNTGNITTKTATFLCQPPVMVSNFKPLQVQCDTGPIKTARLLNGPGNPSEPVTWYATITGGSGNFVVRTGLNHMLGGRSEFVWSGDENRSPPPPFGNNGPAWAINTVTRTGTTPNHVIKISNTRVYWFPGTKSANLSVIDVDNTVAPVIQQTCSNSIDIF